MRSGMHVRSVVGALAVAAVSAGAATAATSAWVKAATPVCKRWHQRSVSVFGAHPKAPTTQAGMYRYLVKARPIEAGTLHDLQAIRVPRSAGVSPALAYAATDVKELDAAIAAYRAGNKQAFMQRVSVWQSDRRASRAFTRIGAPACA